MASDSERPRLGSHVRARRQVIAGQGRVVLHVDGCSLQIGEREWAVLRQADGTRDLEGIRLAAARAGAPVSPEHLAAFLGELTALGLTERAREGAGHPPSFAKDVPIHALPRYAFRCDGSGACCRQYDSVLFSPVEVVRARAILPQLRDAAHSPEAMFMPERGLDSLLCAATRVEGGCAYVDSSHRCRLHAAAGPEGKPIGCRTFPMRFVDVGDEIRVAPRTECACVFASARGESGDPLVEARRGSELEREIFVPELPSEVAMGDDRVGAASLVAFFDALPLEADDPAAFAWGLALEVSARGRAASALGLADPVESEVREAVRAVARSAERLAEQHTKWRGPTDIVRLGVDGVRAALARLEKEPLPAPFARDDELFYLRAAFFMTLGGESSVEAELCSRALALWIARAFPEEARTGDAAAPLALVEALARGHGLDLSGAESSRS